MITGDISNTILQLCSSLPAQLRAIPADLFAEKPAGKWSKKEITGHLIDSATVNLQRFIRGQLEDNPQIFYDQDNWVAVQGYQEYDNEELIRLWESLNRHLANILSKIPESDLTRTCLMRNGEAVTLAYLAEDYVFHLNHHIRQIFK